MTRSLEPELGPDEAGDAIYFDGRVSRKRRVTLSFGPALEIGEDGALLAAWAYGDVRRIDAPTGVMRLRAISAPDTARLEVGDPALQQQIAIHCRLLAGEKSARDRSTLSIVAWSLAATASIVGLVWFGIPILADRIAPLVPVSWEKRLGEVADNQARAMFEGKSCKGREGVAALLKLSQALQRAAHPRLPATIVVIASKVPNAFALPGGKVYLLSGLLAKAQTQDEVAGVLAHELGHVEHRDHLRKMIADGGAAYLIGLLFGDITGGGAMIFIGNTLFSAAHSREAEAGADAFAARTMTTLGRPASPMGALLLRVTGKEEDGLFTILHDHPLSEDRLAQLADADKRFAESGATGPALLTNEEWTALKAICD